MGQVPANRRRVRAFVGVLKRVPVNGWLSICFLVFGVAQLVPGGAAVWQSIELSHRGLHADGVVEAVRYHAASFCYNAGCNDWTEVTVGFTDAQGVTRHIPYPGAENSRVGDRVHVTYAPGDPARLRWNGSSDRRYILLTGGTVCVIFGAGVGVAEWVKARRCRDGVESPEAGPAGG